MALSSCFLRAGLFLFFFRWKDGLLRFLYWNSIFLNASYNFKPFPNFFTRCIAFLTQSNRLRTNSNLSLGVTTNVWCEYSVASGILQLLHFFLAIIWIFLCLFSFPVGSFLFLFYEVHFSCVITAFSFHLFLVFQFFILFFLFLSCLMSPFCSSVLKPNFHLCFGQTQHGADLKPLLFGDVLGCLETLFQASPLQLREDWTTPRTGGSAHGRRVIKGLMGNKVKALIPRKRAMDFSLIWIKKKQNKN